MDRCMEVERNYNSPVFAGAFRFLLGLALLIIGFYIAAFSELRGHGLGYLLVFATPFLIIKDKN